MMRPILQIVIASIALAQDETPLFKTGVSLVKVDAQVQDATGKDINGLRQSDFLVYDEGQQQTVNDFGAEGEPVRVLLLLDVSGSMSRYLADLGAKSTEILTALRAGDRVGLMNFASRTEVVQPLTDNVKTIGAQITGSIYKQTLGRDTYVNEALVDAASYMKTQPGKGRRAILVITDNEGGQKAVTNTDVTKALHGADILLSAILVGEAAGPFVAARYTNPQTAPPDVHRFVRESGGHVVTSSAPADAIRPVLKDVTTRYTLQYTAPSAEEGAFRAIRVELTPAAQAKYPGAKITARSGYTAGR